MTVNQLPGRIREFANYLDGLLARLDQAGGWCYVFWQRDPDGMQACLDGREVPPWDVVEALLQDLAAAYGPAAAASETERARPLHTAALTAYDAGPGARDALDDRLGVMLREQRYAAERQVELGRMLASATSRQEADAIRLDLAWARDDHNRATARCAELRARMQELDRRSAAGRVRDTTDVRPGAGPYGDGSPPAAGRHDARRAAAAEVDDRRDEHGPAAGAADRREGRGASPGTDSGGRETHDVGDSPAHGTHTFGRPADPDHASAAPASAAFGAQAPGSGTPQSARAASHPAPKQRKRRRGSARFAGMAEEEAAPVVVPPTAAPTLPTQSAADDGPRGARFAGAAEQAERPEPQPEPLDATDRRETAAIVERLVRLRAEGRSGDAHALLVEITYWPAARFPLLAAELQRAGLTADWATLLWEAASLPADRLVAAADALAAAGRTADGEHILRQGVARPAAEIGEAVLGLFAQGRRREVRALLDAYVRVRTPEDAARSAGPGPEILVPLLLEAAQGVSDARHWDLVHALRVAGFTA